MAKAKSKARINFGYGAIYQRKTKCGKSRWYLDYRDASGKRVQKVVVNAQTQDHAVMALQSEVLKAFSREFNVKGQPERLRFSAFAIQYLEEYAKVNKAKGSWKADEYYLKGLKGFFGDRYLDEITPQDIEKYKSYRLNQGVRKSTVNRCLSILRKMFNLAVEWGMLLRNHVPKFRLFPEKDNLVERILTEQEEGRLFLASSEALQPILITALNTGMRLGEILSMQWVDVDLVAKKIKIPKTKSGKIRFVNVNARLYSTLTTLKERKGVGPYLFPNLKTGKPLTTVKKAFKTACRKAGILRLRFHDLRHTFASRLVRMGVDLITVKELLGHSSVTITERYTHTLQEQKQKAVELLTGEKMPENWSFLLHRCDAAKTESSNPLFEMPLRCSKLEN